MIRNAQLRCAYHTIRDWEPRCISRRRCGINEINKAVMPQARHVPAAPPVHFPNGDTALLSIYASPTYCRLHSAVVYVKNWTIRKNRCLPSPARGRGSTSGGQLASSRLVNSIRHSTWGPSCGHSVLTWMMRNPD
jgi:hypothetical protein